ncbi:DNA primase family protein [Clostridium guangxiense]|uniref:DNA primase family protein n=1 Tax=Clostridium guangxiense TaxID=1662055 RepID=UPI001E442177|nr:phage/plasmid primase, P4 family [Clostridium guangxiense]MCD2346862.1 phage/plasmid primase, P4 family [Clostridium guangxiense]
MISNNLNQNTTEQPYYNTDETLIQSIKEPKIRTYALMKSIVKSDLFAFYDSVRYYNSSKGYYMSLSYHDAAVIINSSIPDNIKNYLTTSVIKEIFKLIKIEPTLQINSNSLSNNEIFINCNNGVLNLNDLLQNQYTIHPHNRSYSFFNCINANYIPNYSLENSCFSYFLNTITNGDLELQYLLQQIIGYSFSNLNNAKKAFLFYGASNTGKSVLLSVIANICGEENISNISLQDLSKPKYTAELFSKLINICSELPDDDLTNTEIFKALTSETDKVCARRMYQQPFSFYNKCKLIFACNNLPKLSSSSFKDNSAFFNRLIIIPFTNIISDGNQDKCMLNKLLNERDLIFSWAIDGLLNYIRNNFNFTISKKSQQILNHYTNSENSIIEFINERCTISSYSYIHMDILFNAYKEFCNDYCFNTPTNRDKQYLKCLLEQKYNLNYRRLNRPNGNKYGFEGIKLK